VAGPGNLIGDARIPRPTGPIQSRPPGILVSAASDTKLRAQRRSWRTLALLVDVVAAGLAAALAGADTPAAIAGVAAAAALIVGPIVIASGVFLWSIASSWHHRPVSPLVCDIEIGPATAHRKHPPPSTAESPWDVRRDPDPDAWQGETGWKWTHARVLLSVTNQGPYKARKIRAAALGKRDGSEVPLMTVDTHLEMTDIPAHEPVQYVVFEGWEETFEIGSSGGVAVVALETRTLGRRPRDIVGVRVKGRGFPHVDIPLPPEAAAVDDALHEVFGRRTVESE
jgi:hypothetical protein